MEKRNTQLNFNYILRYLKLSCIFSIIIYIIFCWYYKLDGMPGLHGDEAWSGLRASEYLTNGIDKIYGMNHYTGILQALSTRLAFSWIDKSVYSLRISGLLFNAIALLMSWFLFSKSRVYLLFIFIFSQSALYIISPRIAWEVNTFTYFFLILTLLIGRRLLQEAVRHKNILYALFFLISIIGSYNHIIFSSLSVAAFLGLCLWSGFTGSQRFKQQILALFFNLINLIALSVFMNYFLDDMQNIWIFMISLILLISVEIVLINREVFCLWVMPNVKYFAISVLLAGVPFFIYYHGLAILDVFSNFKFIENVYSYKPSIVFRFLLTINATFFLLLFIINLFRDLSTEKNSLPAFLIISYVDVFSIYTTNNSLRYYLIFYLLVIIYMAYKLCYKSKWNIIVLFNLCISCIAIMLIFANIFSQKYKSENLTVHMGNNLIEHSSDFFSKKELIKYLKKQKSLKISTQNDPYFIEQPVYFYYSLNPWVYDEENEISLDFGKNGFLLYPKKNR